MLINSINITITILNSIHRSVSYLKRVVSETYSVSVFR
jgi:hypothetical protein